jgi:hypothetical protein
MCDILYHRESFDENHIWIFLLGQIEMPRVEQTPIGNLGTENTPCLCLDDNPLRMNCTMGSV